MNIHGVSSGQMQLLPYIVCLSRLINTIEIMPLKKTDNDDLRFSSMMNAVIDARMDSQYFWADPDSLVGPIGGRFVNEGDAKHICDNIQNPSGYETHHPLLVVREGGLMYVAGGSHRMQAVCGVIPVDYVPCQIIDVSGISGTGERAFSISKDGPLLVAAVEATEPRSKRYSPLQDCLMMGDIRKSYVREEKRIRKKDKSSSKQLSRSLLDFYSDTSEGCIQAIEIQKRRETKLRAMRGLLKLYDVGEDVLNTLIRHEDHGLITVSERQILVVSSWKPERVLQSCEKAFAFCEKASEDGSNVQARAVFTTTNNPSISGKKRKEEVLESHKEDVHQPQNKKPRVELLDLDSDSSGDDREWTPDQETSHRIKKKKKNTEVVHFNITPDIEEFFSKTTKNETAGDAIRKAIGVVREKIANCDKAYDELNSLEHSHKREGIEVNCTDLTETVKDCSILESVLLMLQAQKWNWRGIHPKNRLEEVLKAANNCYKKLNNGEAISVKMRNGTKTIVEKIPENRTIRVVASKAEYQDILAHPNKLTSDGMIHVLLSVCVPQWKILHEGSVVMKSCVIGTSLFKTGHDVTEEEATDVIRRGGSEMMRSWMNARTLICIPCRDVHWSLCVMVRDSDEHGNVKALNSTSTTVYTLSSQQGNEKRNVRAIWKVLKHIESLSPWKDFKSGERKAIRGNEFPRTYSVAVPEQTALECGMRTIWHYCLICLVNPSFDEDECQVHELVKVAISQYPYDIFVEHVLKRLRRLNELKSEGVRHASPLMLSGIPTGRMEMIERSKGREEDEIVNSSEIDSPEKKTVEEETRPTKEVLRNKEHDEAEERKDTEIGNLPEAVTNHPESTGEETTRQYDVLGKKGSKDLKRIAEETPSDKKLVDIVEKDQAVLEGVAGKGNATPLLGDESNIVKVPLTETLHEKTDTAICLEKSLDDNEQSDEGSEEAKEKSVGNTSISEERGRGRSLRKESDLYTVGSIKDAKNTAMNVSPSLLWDGCKTHEVYMFCYQYCETVCKMEGRSSTDLGKAVEAALTLRWTPKRVSTCYQKATKSMTLLTGAEDIAKHL